MTWLWIPITIAAAFSQNIRTALQKHLKGQLSTNGAAFTRFAYGFPFALAYVLALHLAAGLEWPAANAAFAGWVSLGSVTQILATSLLIHAFSFRNFAVGVAYSKTEVVQAALFGLIFLGETVTAWGAAAIVVGTVGVMLISLTRSERPVRAFLLGWTEKAALIGIASGAMFGVSAVSFRAASLSLEHPSFLMSAAYTLAWATVMQTVMLGIWLYWRERAQLAKVIATWRVSALVGLSGVVGSAGWFTAMTIQKVAYVRTLGLIELLFTFAISHFVFKERTTPTELAGIMLLIVGIAMVLQLR